MDIERGGPESGEKVFNFPESEEDDIPESDKAPEISGVVGMTEANINEEAAKLQELVEAQTAAEDAEKARQKSEALDTAHEAANSAFPENKEEKSA